MRIPRRRALRTGIGTIADAARRRNGRLEQPMQGRSLDATLRMGPRSCKVVSTAVQAASSGGGAWRRHVKSDVLLPGAWYVSRWPASASYSQS
jgi:hypothetical protein